MRPRRATRGSIALVSFSERSSPGRDDPECLLPDGQFALFQDSGALRQNAVWSSSENQEN